MREHGPDASRAERHDHRGKPANADRRGDQVDHPTMTFSLDLGCLVPASGVPSRQRAANGHQKA
jgi:hypothetical protein